MLTFKKILITSSIMSLIAITNLSVANESGASKLSATKGSLKLVMQGLLTDTQQLTSAMLTEDFARIEKIAKNIADHPKPSMATRMKLMKAMGSDMAKFKANDSVVHEAAVAMVKNAQNKDIKSVGDNFQTMIGGCLSCHDEFKGKVSDILK